MATKRPLLHSFNQPQFRCTNIDTQKERETHAQRYTIHKQTKLFGCYAVFVRNPKISTNKLRRYALFNAKIIIRPPKPIYQSVLCYGAQQRSQTLINYTHKFYVKHISKSFIYINMEMSLQYFCGIFFFTREILICANWMSDNAVLRCNFISTIKYISLHIYPFNMGRI